MQHIMVGVLTLYEVFAYFFLYSFLGWVTEVAFHAVTQGKFVNRGFLNGPVCPIYGTGMVAVLLILGEYVSRPWAVFLVGVALPTAIELVTGWILERFFHNKWWDYSSRRFNLKGYICLEFSILWGVSVLFAVEVVHPAAVWFVGLFSEFWGTLLIALCSALLLADLVITFSEFWGTLLIALCSALLLADLVITILQVLKLNRILGEIDRAAERMRKGADLIGSGVASATLFVDRKAKEVRERFDERLDELAARLPRRFFSAFPNLRSRRSPEAVKLARERLLLLQARLKARKEHRKEEKRKKKGG